MILEPEFQPPPLPARSGDRTQRRRQRERQRRHSKTKVQVICDIKELYEVARNVTV